MEPFSSVVVGFQKLLDWLANRLSWVLPKNADEACGDLSLVSSNIPSPGSHSSWRSVAWPPRSWFFSISMSDYSIDSRETNLSTSGDRSIWKIKMIRTIKEGDDPNGWKHSLERFKSALLYFNPRANISSSGARHLKADKSRPLEQYEHRTYPLGMGHKSSEESYPQKESRKRKIQSGKPMQARSGNEEWRLSGVTRDRWTIERKQ